MSSFVEDVLDARALSENLDDYVEQWHSAPDDSPAAQQQLHEFLGMTWDEYRLITERPYSLRFVIASRRLGLPLEQVVREASSLTLAARADSQEDAQSVLNWLIKTKRI